MTVCKLASALTLAGGFFMLARAGAAAEESCPQSLLLESSNGKYYVAVLGAKAVEHASLHVTAYAKSRSFVFAKSDVAIDKGTPLPYAPYRSTPIVFENPGNEPLLGATLSVAPSGGTPCTDLNVIVPPVSEVAAPHRRASPERATLEREVAGEVSAFITNPIVLGDDPNSVALACDDPFGSAETVTVVSPVYPPLAILQRATGTVQVKVTLDATGAVTLASIYKSSDNLSLDAAAVDAARRTTYRPGHFACRPVGGQYIFRADFNARRS